MSAVLKIDRASLAEIAHQQLTKEFVHAFFESPEATVSTPAWKNSHATVAAVISDNFAGCDGGEALRELLRIVTGAARGGEPRAIAWIVSEAKRFAEVHENDRAIELAGEDE